MFYFLMDAFSKVVSINNPRINNGTHMEELVLKKKKKTIITILQQFI